MPDMPNLADMPELKDMPDITSRRCGGKGGDGENMVIDKSRGARKVMIICTDRITRMASLNADRMVRARDMQRMAYDRALEGMRRARESLARDASLSAERKADALQGIDEAIREMESERAQPD